MDRDLRAFLIKDPVSPLGLYFSQTLPDFRLPLLLRSFFNGAPAIHPCYFSYLSSCVSLGVNLGLTLIGPCSFANSLIFIYLFFFFASDGFLAGFYSVFRVYFSTCFDGLSNGGRPSLPPLHFFMQSLAAFIPIYGFFLILLCFRSTLRSLIAARTILSPIPSLIHDESLLSFSPLLFL